MLIPSIKQVDGFWSGSITLISWNQFFDKKMDIELNIGGDKTVESLEPRHILAYEYLMINQEKILQNILNELLAQYPSMQKEYEYEDEEMDECMPDINDIQELKKIIKPRRIYILDIENNGVAYIGFHFYCRWDEEHDYGVMTHKERIVKMGGGDVAFLSWIAEEDKMKTK